MAGMDLAVPTVNPDFSKLPDIVWVEIFSFLPLGDRARASETCHTLLDIFHHPSLWNRMDLQISSFGERFHMKTSLFMPSVLFEAVSHFGKYFQHLQVSVDGYISSLPKEYTAMFQQLGDCRLEKLTLNVGCLLSKNDFYWERPRRINIDAILLLITRSTRLKHLDVISWPMYPKIYSSDIMQAIRQNDRLCYLEHLNLFGTGGTNSDWTTMNAVLPSPEVTERTLERLSCLRTLKIRSPMLKADLLSLFTASQCRPLEKLSVLVTYSRHDTSAAVPEIPSSVWSALKQKSPRLKVDFTLSTRIPFDELVVLLNTEVPLTQITFMKYSECRAATIRTISELYSRTLTKFVDFSEGCEDVDLVMKDLVMKCQGLDHLIYKGPLQLTTVLELAKARRKNWKRFEINKEKIVTKNIAKSGYEGYSVVQTRDDGSVTMMTVPVSSQSPEERQAVIIAMNEEISEILNSE